MTDSNRNNVGWAGVAVTCLIIIGTSVYALARLETLVGEQAQVIREIKAEIFEARVERAAIWREIWAGRQKGE